MPAGLPMDLHCHSENSFDAAYTVMEMCKAAIQKRIDIVTVTDHYEISGFELDFEYWDTRLRRSLADIRSAGDCFKDRLRVLAGVELGQPLENLSKAEEILSSHSFDFVLGSLHNAPGRLDPYYLPDHPDKDLLDRELQFYFDNLLHLVHWGCFDSAAHITYPFRHIVRRMGDGYPFRRWDDHLESIVKILAEKGLALEVNTQGMAKDPPHTLPDIRWVKRFREFGGEKLTLGSDAHNPSAVGVGIREGMRIAAEAGFTRLCYFVGRKPHYLNLADYMN